LALTFDLVGSPLTLGYTLFVCCRLYRCCLRLFSGTAARLVAVKMLYL